MGHKTADSLTNQAAARHMVCICQPWLHYQLQVGNNSRLTVFTLGLSITCTNENSEISVLGEQQCSTPKTEAPKANFTSFSSQKFFR